MMVRVLIVEDHAGVAEVTKDLVERCCPGPLPGFRCTISPTVRTARDVLGRKPFDVVLTDWDLPDGSGEDVAKLTSLPVVVYSGGTHLHWEAMKRCAHAVLRKPQDVATLQRALYHAAQVGAIQ
jgi:DNA-binding NtrC family response regulator